MTVNGDLTRLNGTLSVYPMGRVHEEGNHKLTSTEECRAGIAAAKPNDSVTIERVGKLLRFSDADGRLLGTLTERHALAKRLADGEPVLHCRVAWLYAACERYPFGLASARVATGDPADSHVQWLAKNVWGKPVEPRPVRSYSANIVGESFHQDAIRNCRAGELAVLCRESGNPHDPKAIVVKSAAGETIGHIPRSSWLQRVIHEEGGGIAATIKAIHPGPPAAVVLDVTVTADPIGEAPYPQSQITPPTEEATPVAQQPPTNWLGKLFGR